MNTFSTVMLVVTIITGSDKPNIQHKEPMPDMKTCLEEAESFLDHKFPDTVEAKGLVAACNGKLTTEEPS
jgi:hypothetical protein